MLNEFVKVQDGYTEMLLTILNWSSLGPEATGLLPRDWAGSRRLEDVRIVACV